MHKKNKRYFYLTNHTIYFCNGLKNLPYVTVKRQRRHFVNVIFDWNHTDAFLLPFVGLVEFFNISLPFFIIGGSP